MKDIIQVMPAVALRGMTILPDMIVHFDVSRSKSKKAIERAMTTNQKLFVVTQRDPDIEEPEKEEVFTAGCIVTIKQMTKLLLFLIKYIFNVFLNFFVDVFTRSYNYRSITN